MCLMATPSWEVAQMLVSTTSKWGLDREAQAALLSVKMGPEYPEAIWGSLHEIATQTVGQPERERKERERGRERENYPTKSPNLRHCWPALRTKDWANTSRELAGCGPAHPPPEAGMQAGGAVRAGKGQSQPQRWHPLPNCNQAPSY